MSSQGTTKEKMLKLIASGTNTLSAICKELNLAPSTVSKHLHDLEDSGIISHRDDEHIRKWKYYYLNSGINESKAKEGRIILSKKLIILSISLLALFGAIALFLYAYALKSNAVYVPVSITDPPQVPYGTQALYINYSSIEAYVTYKNGSSLWSPLNGSGRLDLLTLINVSQVISAINITKVKSVKAIRFNISASSITINNVTYNVQVQSNRVTAYISNGTLGSYSSLLLDFLPVVTPIYTNNSIKFMLTSSLIASASRNSMQHLFRPELPIYKKYPCHAPTVSNLTISNVKLASSHSYINFSLTVKNTGRYNITLMFINLLGGSISPYKNFSSFGIGNDMPMPSFNSSNASIYSISNGSAYINGSEAFILLNYNPNSNISLHLPKPVNNIFISGIDRMSPQNINSKFMFMHPMGINFIVNGNGTLSLPSIAMLAPMHMQPGYTLMPNSSVTLYYNGTLKLGNIPMFANFSNSSYNIVVVTDRGMLEENRPHGN